MIYLKEFTTFFQDFFGHVTCMSESEIEVFICGLIFRHAIIQRTKLIHFKCGVTNKRPGQVKHLQEHKVETGETDFVQKSMKVVKKFYNDCFQRCGENVYETKLHHLENKPLQQFLKRLEQLYSQETDKQALEQPLAKTFLEETSEANEYQKLLINLTSTHKKKINLKEIFKKFAQEVKTNQKYHTRPKSINNCFEQKFSCLYPTLTNFEHSCRPNTILM